ncbi:HAD family hydrolase [Polyangium sp. y55x31]|uniref:HAD family hydrolase n=1 Tax=Polyangium sp. y55x31 TaxID=3042688 RepID=UPI0024828248|nr:HAD family hydrolase [Polyangium sp. y55x31]MDI1484716.1 HAD family hydrolase [Polyangium sp. y55x31]
MVQEKPLLRTALVYDFDGTLAPGNIQEHSLIPNHLGLRPADFWQLVHEVKKAEDADEVLVYLRLLLVKAAERSVKLTRAILQEHGAKTPLFQGVASWFARIDEHAAQRGLRLEHYVISSGNEEMIAGTSIHHVFRQVFASRYFYDDQGNAVWPAVAINYTTKTQYLFRINKGVDNNWNNEAVNRWQPMAERPVPFSRIIYLGDGDTDIPSMKMVRHQGGHSVAVFDPERWAKGELQGKAYNLIAEDRAHFVVPADYREGSQLDITIKGILGRIARDEAGYRESARS